MVQGKMTPTIRERARAFEKQYFGTDTVIQEEGPFPEDWNLPVEATWDEGAKERGSTMQRYLRRHPERDPGRKVIIEKTEPKRDIKSEALQLKAQLDEILAKDADWRSKLDALENRVNPKPSKPIEKSEKSEAGTFCDFWGCALRRKEKHVHQEKLRSN